MITAQELQAIIDMKNITPSDDRWHSIRLTRLQAICKLALTTMQMQAMSEISKTVPAPAFQPKRKGVDFPCSLFPGPAGDCNETNCRCA